MKKILLIIILSCLYINVKAETIYGDYFKVENIDGVDSDLIKVDSYKLYNTYNLEYIDMGYLEENDLYIKDESDYIFRENIVEKVTEYDEMINVNTYTVHKRNIYFSELSNNLKIYEIEVLKNGEKVDNYKIYYNKNYEVLDINNINDEDYDTYFLNTTNSKNFYIAISFDRTINLNEIEIIVYTKKDDDMHFTLLLEGYKVVNLNNNVDRKHIISFTETRDREDVEYFYKNKYKLYKYYKEEKVPTNIYVDTGDNILLDDYKEENELYMRNKLILKDELIIKDKNTNIYDFIEYSTSTPVINCDIDLNINGVYKCLFLLDGLSVEKNIVVDIKEEYDDIVLEEIKVEKVEGIENSNEFVNVDENIVLEDSINIVMDNNEYNPEINQEETITIEEIKTIEEKNLIEETCNIFEEEQKEEVVSKQDIIINLKIEKENKESVNKHVKKQNNFKNKKELTTTKRANKNNYAITTTKLSTNINGNNYTRIIKIVMVFILIIFNIISILKNKRK